ncbi:hypothetical protein AFR_12070 [Actinoplanes friuliensis DSM 7358]|uniref:Uncharacterized protein n=1 Tax=Actinoplanes friuliensis DSM 7358 TaxID=1246995 RepID=U5VYB5_9ACTN|nr:hypothetical protein AFR_12070 [Actinoplanes friuliensis DSM 7358]
MPDVSRIQSAMSGGAAGVERGAVTLDLGVAVRDGAVELFALVAGAEGGERGAVVGIGQAAQVGGEALAAQLSAKEAVDRLDDGFFTEVEHRWVGNLVLADVVAGCLAAVV